MAKPRGILSPSEDKVRFPVALVAAAVVTMLSLMIWSRLAEHSTTASHQADLSIQTQIASDSARILHLDEILTMSARMAAATGDKAWIDRYNRFVPELDHLIKETARLAQSKKAEKQLARTDESNKQLVRMETASFRLVLWGRRQQAWALLTGPEYLRQKAIYMSGVNAFLREIGSEGNSRARRGADYSHIRFLARLAMNCLVLTLWFLALRRIGFAWKRKAEKLRESEESLSTTLHSIGDAVISTDANGRVLSMNPVAEELTGWTLSDATARPISEVLNIVNALTGEPAPIPVDEVLSTGEVCHLLNHTTLISRDGTQRQIADSAAPIRDDSGAIIGVVLVFSDVTEQYLIREQLRESEDKFRSLFESSRDAVMTLEPPSWMFTSCNQATVKMFGAKDAEEFTSLGPWEVSPELQPDGRASGDKAKENIETAMRDGSHFFEWTHKRISGEQFFATVLLSRIEQDGKVFLQATVRDVSDQKQIEEEREKTLLRQQGVSQLRQSLLAPGSLEDKLNIVTAGIVRLFDAEFCRVWVTMPGDMCERGCVHADVVEGPHLCRQRDKCLRLLASSGRYTHIDGESHQRIPFGCYKIGLIAAGEDHKFLTNDVQNDSMVHNPEWARELGLVSFAGYQLRIPDGERLGVLALFSKRPISAAEDAVLDGVATTVAIVIQQTLAEEALRDSEEQYRVIFEGSSHGIVMTDSETMRFVYANASMCRMLGYTESEFLQLGVADIHPKVSLGQVVSEIESIAREEETAVSVVLPCLRKDGVLIYAEVTHGITRRGGRKCNVGFFTDITERKQVERRQQLSTKVLGILNEPAALLDAINRILISIRQEMEFDAVGIRLQSGEDFPYFAQDGFSEDFLLTENTLACPCKKGDVYRDEHGSVSLECTCGLVISGQTDPTNPLFTPGGSFWTNNSCLLLDLSADQDPRLHPRNRCIHEGFLSFALIPISANQEIIGLLQLNARRMDHLTLDMIRYFEDISASIGMGLMKRQAEEKLRESEEKFRVMFEGSAYGILMADSKTKQIIYANPSACGLFGYTESELLKLGVTDIHPKDTLDHVVSEFESQARGEKTLASELQCLRKDGTVFYADITTAVIILKGGQECTAGFFADVTDRKRATDELLSAKAEIEAVNRQLEEALLVSKDHAAAVEVAKDLIEESAVELRHQATHDSLTGLPNRNQFGQHLTELIVGGTGRRSRSMAVLFLDLDKFKLINDTLGHKVGDLLLVEVAERLRSCLRSGDVLARMGGDEFTVILPRCRSRSIAQSVAARMIGSIGRPFEIQGHRFVIGASIGLASYPSNGTDAVTLLKHADAAMYKAKQSGRDTFRWFTGDVDVDNQQRADLEMEIRAALEKGQFNVHYQPIVSLEDGSIIAAEALLRWEHPEKGMISPSLFIPIAEDIGMIGQIGNYVLRTACAQTVAWHDEGIYLSQMGVNVSTRQVRDSGWLDSVRAALSDTGLDAQCLNLEVTETDFSSDYESMKETLQKVQELGIRMAIDDFGIGQSSLSRLKDFPVIHLKIDGSFIRDIEHSKSDNSLVRSIIEMAHGQRIKVTAEWVETESQMEILRAIGCDFAQGYLISPALSAEAFGDFIREWTFAQQKAEAA